MSKKKSLFFVTYDFHRHIALMLSEWWKEERKVSEMCIWKYIYLLQVKFSHSLTCLYAFSSTYKFFSVCYSFIFTWKSLRALWECVYSVVKSGHIVMKWKREHFFFFQYIARRWGTNSTHNRDRSREILLSQVDIVGVA